MGIAFRELLEMAGGVDGGTLKAFSPGGASSGFLPASAIDVAMDFASLGRSAACWARPVSWSSTTPSTWSRRRSPRRSSSRTSRAASARPAGSAPRSCVKRWSATGREAAIRAVLAHVQRGQPGGCARPASAVWARRRPLRPPALAPCRITSEPICRVRAGSGREERERSGARTSSIRSLKSRLRRHRRQRGPFEAGARPYSRPRRPIGNRDPDPLPRSAPDVLPGPAGCVWSRSKGRGSCSRPAPPGSRPGWWSAPDTAAGRSQPAVHPLAASSRHHPGSPGVAEDNNPSRLHELAEIATARRANGPRWNSSARSGGRGGRPTLHRIPCRSLHRLLALHPLLRRGGGGQRHHPGAPRPRHHDLDRRSAAA